MKGFLWTILILHIVTALSFATWLGTGQIPPRTKGALAVDLVVALALCGWIAHLLTTV